MDTIGFKQYDELNDEAKRELVQELTDRALQNISEAFIGEFTETFGDLVDGHNVPPGIASEIMHAAFYDALMDEIEHEEAEPDEFAQAIFDVGFAYGIFDERDREALENDGLYNY